MPLSSISDHLIDGKFVDSVGSARFDDENPATGERIASVASGQSEDIDRAVLAARNALENGPWSRMTGRDRGKLLWMLADRIEAEAGPLARLEVKDNGKPIAEVSRGDLPHVVDTFRYFAGWADKLTGETIPVSGNQLCYTRREPVGVIGQIIPWNFPMVMVAWKWAPALACGNTVVLKPAEQTPLTALRLGELAMEVGFPDGVINIVNGFGETAGDALVKHEGVDKIAFTGELSTAKTIMKNAADTMKRVSFELGGKSPNIVLKDADLDAAVDGAINGIFTNQGEVCCAGSRLFLDDEIHDEFLERLVEKSKSRKVGDPLDPTTEQGAQVSQEQFEKVLRYIEIGKEEADLACGGERVGDRGYFVQPTVFRNVKNDMRIAREEIFGPVLSVLRFEDAEDGLNDANHTPFGLAASIWTKDPGRAISIAHRLKAGTVWVNGIGSVDPAAPFGGFKQSGIGRELGRTGLDAYTELKTVWVQMSTS